MPQCGLILAYGECGFLHNWKVKFLVLTEYWFCHTYRRDKCWIYESRWFPCQESNLDAYLLSLVSLDSSTIMTARDRKVVPLDINLSCPKVLIYTFSFFDSALYSWHHNSFDGFLCLRTIQCCPWEGHNITRSPLQKIVDKLSQLELILPAVPEYWYIYYSFGEVYYADDLTG